MSNVFRRILAIAAIAGAFAIGATVFPGQPWPTARASVSRDATAARPSCAQLLKAYRLVSRQGRLRIGSEQVRAGVAVARHDEWAVELYRAGDWLLARFARDMHNAATRARFVRAITASADEALEGNGCTGRSGPASVPAGG